MATTTNYSWVTPDDTALVKDGAAAIRTLGSSIDTTTKALNPSTTLGDIEYRSSTANTNTRLGIGTSGQVLTVNGSGVPAWATAPTGGMTSISSGSLPTGAGTVTISSIPTTYNSLILFVRQLTSATDQTNLRLRLNGDTGTAYSNPVNATGSFTLANTSILLNTNIDNTKQNFSSIIEIPDYANADVPKIVPCVTMGIEGSTDSYSTINARMGYGYYGNTAGNSTAAITSVTLFLDSGNFATGTYVLYGVK